MVREIQVSSLESQEKSSKDKEKPDEKTRPKKAVELDALLKQMWPLLMVYRLLCRFPFKRRNDGKLEMKMFSFQTAYFAVGFVAQTYLVLDNGHSILLGMFFEKTDFADIVTGGLNVCILSMQLFVPFSIIREWKLLCEVFNKWISFQERYKVVVKEDYKTRLNIVVTLVAGAIPVTTFSLTVLHSSILFHREWYHLTSYILVIMSVCTLYSIWVFSLIEIIRSSDTIRKMSYEVIQSKAYPNKSTELYNLRILWHDLSIIVRASSTAVACSMIYTSATGVVIFIASAYGFMQCVALGDERYLLFFSIMLAMGFVLCVPCEIGYRATIHAGRYLVEMLSSVNLRDLDEATVTEVDLFLQAVYANYPNVSYGGMVQINRETVTSLMSATLTYLIVLLQLRVRKTSESASTSTVRYEEDEKPFLIKFEDWFNMSSVTT